VNFIVWLIYYRQLLTFEYNWLKNFHYKITFSKKSKELH
jgi:hypothetical protein